MQYVIDMDVAKKEFLKNLMADFMTISYSGAFDGNVLAAFAKRVENNISSNPKISKKIFKIFVELAQNIAMYSSDKIISDDKSTFNGFGIFVIREYPENFQLIAGNMAFKEDADIALEKCRIINEMDREALRDYKRKLRKQPASYKGGGNIGLVQVVLTANSKIDYWSKNVDEKHTFLALSVYISKN